MLNKFYVKAIGLLIVIGLLFPALKGWYTSYKTSLQNYKQSANICLSQSANLEFNIRLTLKGHKFVTWFEQYKDTLPYVKKTFEFEDTVITVIIKKDDPIDLIKSRQYYLKDLQPISLKELDSLFSICINDGRNLAKDKYFEYIDIKKNDTIKTFRSGNKFDTFNVVTDIDTLDILKTIGVRAQLRIPVWTILKDNIKDFAVPTILAVFCLVIAIFLVINLKRKHQKDFRFFHKVSKSNEQSFREIVDHMNQMYEDLDDDDSGMKSKLIHIVKDIDEQAWNNGRFWRYLKNEEGEIRFMMGPTFLFPMLMELKQKYESTENKKVSVVVKCPEDLLIVTDENYLRSILVELLNNSVRFSDEIVHIDINAYEEKNVTFISVRDNGWGIPKNEQDHVFENGYQIQSHIERLNDDSGLGLGLAYVESFVSSLDGGITLISIEGDLTMVQLSFGITEGHKSLIKKYKAIMKYLKK